MNGIFAFRFCRECLKTWRFLEASTGSRVLDDTLHAQYSRIVAKLAVQHEPCPHAGKPIPPWMVSDLRLCVNCEQRNYRNGTNFCHKCEGILIDALDCKLCGRPAHFRQCHDFEVRPGSFQHAPVFGCECCRCVKYEREHKRG